MSMSPSTETLLCMMWCPCSATEHCSVAKDNDLAMDNCSLLYLADFQVWLRALILALHCNKLHFYLCWAIWAQKTTVNHPVLPIVTSCTDDPLFKLSDSLRTVQKVPFESWYAGSTHCPGQLFFMVFRGKFGAMFYVWSNFRVVSFSWWKMMIGKTTSA